ncbi:MAG: hypothetical protein JWN95_4096 [Frankiales bacterium]|nr:hypothetical protein [Frankiales bacterium]
MSAGGLGLPGGVLGPRALSDDCVAGQAAVSVSAVGHRRGWVVSVDDQ